MQKLTDWPQGDAGAALDNDYISQPQPNGDVMQLVQSQSLNLRQVHAHYEAAMLRRRTGALPVQSFVAHFDDEDGVAFGDEQHGYLLGMINGQYMMVSHFAPVSIRAGVALIKALGQAGQVAVLAVTEDLDAMLSRVPEWIDSEIKAPAMFRDQAVIKHVYCNDAYTTYEVLRPIWDGIVRGVVDFNDSLDAMMNGSFKELLGDIADQGEPQEEPEHRLVLEAYARLDRYCC